MDANKEIFYFGQLMSLSMEEVLSNWSDFVEILNRLSESHEQVIFEVTQQNISSFRRFADWLVKVADLSIDSGSKEGLINYAAMFRLDPSDHFDWNR